MKKPPAEERAIIVRQPHKRPYGARVSVHLQTAASIGNLQDVCLLLPSGGYATVSRDTTAPWDGGDRVRFEIEGFSTATAAEAGGRRLVSALLWTAIKLNFPVRVDYRGYEPTAVFERLRSTGVQVSGFATVGWPPEKFLSEVHQAYGALPVPDPKVLLSMEIFAGARLESSERARFIACVSALEPLAEKQPLGSDVEKFVAETLELLKAKIPERTPVRASLEGRIRQLRNESIRQAIKRMLSSSLPGDKAALRTVDDAYGLRSELVHSGRPDDLDTDLEAEYQRVASVICKLYAQLLNQQRLGDKAG